MTDAVDIRDTETGQVFQQIATASFEAMIDVEGRVSDETTSETLPSVDAESLAIEREARISQELAMFDERFSSDNVERVNFELFLRGHPELADDSKLGEDLVGDAQTPPVLDSQPTTIDAMTEVVLTRDRIEQQRSDELAVFNALTDEYPQFNALRDEFMSDLDAYIDELQLGLKAVDGTA